MTALPDSIAAFVAAAEADAARPEAGEISDEALAAAMTAAVKLYAARAEARGTHPPPLVGEKAMATEVVVTVCEMIRQVDLNMFDVSMWFGRGRSRQ